MVVLRLISAMAYESISNSQFVNVLDVLTTNFRRKKNIFSQKIYRAIKLNQKS